MLSRDRFQPQSSVITGEVAEDIQEPKAKDSAHLALSVEDGVV